MKREYLARVLSSLFILPKPSSMHINIATQFTPANIHLHIPYGVGHTLSQHSQTYVFANTYCHWETAKSSQVLLKPNKTRLAAHSSSVQAPTCPSQGWIRAQSKL